MLAFDSFSYNLLQNNEKINSLYDGYNSLAFSIPNFNFDINLFATLMTYPNNKFFEASLKGTVLQIFPKKIYVRNQVAAVEQARDLARKIPITLHAELDEFSILFALYLDTISTDFDKNVNHDFINSCEYAINFNYTNFLSKYYEENNVVLLDCVSINGSVNEDESLCPIVFGVSNETNFKNQDFNMFKKNLQRSINSTRIGHLANILSEYYNGIVIFGHSLSKSDLDTFASIFKKLLSEHLVEFGPSIYIFYLDQESKKNLVLNIERILNRVKDNLFNEYQIFDKLIFVKAPSN